MDLEWDEAKDAENRRKHGLSLADAARLDWTAGDIEPDTRRNYGEARWDSQSTARGKAARLRFHLAEREEAHHFVEKGQPS
jgi:uncharacterized protein